jgi:hypothetical protein
MAERPSRWAWPPCCHHKSLPWYATASSNSGGQPAGREILSGATLTSKGWLQCVENALLPAQRE